MSDRADLLQGTLDLLILKSLVVSPLHGWAISKRIRELSRDVLQVNQGSLYPALYRLEDRGWVVSEWGTSPEGRRAKFYKLTPTRTEADYRGAGELAAVCDGDRARDSRRGESREDGRREAGAGRSENPRDAHSRRDGLRGFSLPPRFPVSRFPSSRLLSVPSSPPSRQRSSRSPRPSPPTTTARRSRASRSGRRDAAAPRGHPFGAALVDRLEHLGRRCRRSASVRRRGSGPSRRCRRRRGSRCSCRRRTACAPVASGARVALVRVAQRERRGRSTRHPGGCAPGARRTGMRVASTLVPLTALGAGARAAHRPRVRLAA